MVLACDRTPASRISVRTARPLVRRWAVRSREARHGAANGLFLLLCRECAFAVLVAPEGGEALTQAWHDRTMCAAVCTAHRVPGKGAGQPTSRQCHGRIYRSMHRTPCVWRKRRPADRTSDVRTGRFPFLVPVPPIRPMDAILQWFRPPPVVAGTAVVEVGRFARLESCGVSQLVRSTVCTMHMPQ